MIDLDEIKDIASRRYDGFEIYSLKERNKRFESKEGEICGVDLKEEEGIALRVFKAGKMAFGYTFDVEKGLTSLLERIEMLLPHMEIDEDRELPGTYKDYPEIDIFDNTGLKIDDTRKAKYAVDLNKTIRDYDKRIVAVRNCELQETTYDVRMENSRGLAVQGRKSLYSLAALSVAREEDEVSWYDWAWSHNLRDLNTDELGVDIARKSLSLLGGRQIETGTYAGILTPQAACDLLGILSDSFLAENLYKEKTYLKGKEGTQCFSEKLTIVDSGTVGMDAFPFDGEGVPSRKNILVDGGYFKTYLYDVYYGKKFAVASTGSSGRSGLKDLPTCAARGLYIEAGTRDIRNDAGDCIIIEELMGVHTANPITGDFSLGAVGFLRKNGQLNPFQGVIFSGAIFEVLRNVKEVGNDLRFYGSVGAPSLFVEELKISGT